jgi:hypothetical protein
MTSKLTLLDEVLPNYDVSAEYSTQVRAKVETVYAILQKGFPAGSVTKLLMMLRKIPRIFRRHPGPAPAEDSFYRLKQLENREIVVGIIGQFWKPVANVVSIHSLDEFLDFKKEGYCKAAMNLTIQVKTETLCVVKTETRVLSYGKAKDSFNKYWTLIGPFSGLIRKEALRNIKRQAEKSAAL